MVERAWPVDLDGAFVVPAWQGLIVERSSGGGVVFAEIKRREKGLGFIFVA